MRKGTKVPTILISFVGTNDAGRLTGASDGAVLTVFKKRRFDQVHLLWNPSKGGKVDFQEIAQYVQSEILGRGYSEAVRLHHFECNDVTDHNEIYPKLLSVCQLIKGQREGKFTAAIASGTPAMQVCWILMAESGDFPLELIRSNEPRFGKPLVTPVKLATGLPRILRLQEENKQLRQEKEALIPSVQIRCNDGSTAIGGTVIPFGPIESVYYRYFADRAKRQEPPERISGRSIPTRFLRQILEYHMESYPEAEASRFDLERMVRKGETLAMETFRGNVSKTNKKIRIAITNPSVAGLFSISAQGVRNSKSYGLLVPPEKIVII